MAAGNYPLALEAGSLYQETWTWRTDVDPETLAGGTLVNLTGYTARFQIRRNLTDADALLTLNTENGGITLGGVAGTIVVRITATQTAALGANVADTRNNRLGRYELDLIPPSGAANTRRLMEGQVTLSGNVSR